MHGERTVGSGDYRHGRGAKWQLRHVQPTQRHSGSGDRLIGNPVHDADAMHEKPAVKAVSEWQGDEEPALSTRLWILADVVDRWLAVEICLAVRNSFLAGSAPAKMWSWIDSLRPCWQAQPAMKNCPPSWLMPSMLPMMRPTLGFDAGVCAHTVETQRMVMTNAATSCRFLHIVSFAIG